MYIMFSQQRFIAFTGEKRSRHWKVFLTRVRVRSYVDSAWSSRPACATEQFVLRDIYKLSLRCSETLGPINLSADMVDLRSYRAHAQTFIRRLFLVQNWPSSIFIGWTHPGIVYDLSCQESPWWRAEVSSGSHPPVYPPSRDWCSSQRNNVVP